MHFRKHSNLHLMIVALSGALACSGAALAQDTAVGAIERNTDKNGIDIGTSGAVFSETSIGLGDSSSGGLEYRRTINGASGSWSSNLNFRVDLGTIIGMYGDPIDAWYAVTGGSIRDDFNGCTGGACPNRLGTGASLSQTTTTYTYTGGDGTVINFTRYTNGTDDYNSFGSSEGFPTSLVKPNGEKLTFTYYEMPSYGRKRLSAVQSNLGYMVKFQYLVDNRTTSNNQDWHRLVNVKVINSGVDYCDPSALSCSGFTQTWPQLSMATTVSSGDSTITETVTDSAGGILTYLFAGGQYNDGWRKNFLLNVKRGASGETLISYPNQGLSIVTQDGTTTYSQFSSNCSVIHPTRPETRGYTNLTYRTDPQGGQLNVVTWYYSGKLACVKDENGDTTRYQYDDLDRLIYAIPPEGTFSGTTPVSGFTKNDYDARGNVVQVTKVGKAGSGLPDIVTTSGFDVTCSNIKTCNKPNWTRDAKGQQTDYTYDPAHGGVLSVMKPAATQGAPGSGVTARPLTLTSWAQRYSWVKNASNVLVQSADPIWLISSVTQCQTAPGSVNTPTCDGSAPQTVTTYEYGANGTRESLLVKGIAVTSAGVTLRTCNGYDLFNRRISETKPNANLGSCS